MKRFTPPALLTLCLLLSACSSRSSEKDNQWVEVTAEKSSRVIEEIGILEARELARIQNIVSGTISQAAEDGIRVEKGDVLVQLDDEDLRTDLENRLADLDQRKEELENELAEYVVITNSFEMATKLKQAQLAHARLKMETEIVPLTPEETRLREIEIELARLDLQDKQDQFNRDQELVKNNFAPLSSLQAADRELEAAKTFLEEKQTQLALDSLPLPEEERLTLSTAVKNAEDALRRNNQQQNRDLRIQALKIEGLQLKIQHTQEAADKILNQLDHVILTAPTGGILRLNQNWVWSMSTWMPISSGQRVRDFDIIGTVVNPDDLSLRVIVHESDFPLLETGQKISARLTSFPDQELTGQIDSITELGQDRNDLSPIYRQAPAIHQALFLVTITLDSLSDRAIPGMTALTRIDVGAQTTKFFVPRNALRKQQDGYELIRKREGKTETLSVEAHETGDDWFEVLEGLQPGDQVKILEETI